MISNVLVVVPPLVNVDDEADPGLDRPDFEARRLVSPIEPTTVAAVLRDRGYAVRLFDLGVHVVDRYRALAREVAEHRPDAVVMVQAIITFATAQDWDGKTVFDAARQQAPDVLTVLTGNNATNYPGKAVGEGVCDYSIRGEVEFAVAELLDALNKGHDPLAIAGVSGRREDGTVAEPATYPSVNVAELPLPAYDLLDAHHHSQYSRVLEVGKIRYPEHDQRYRDIMTSRSCILRCSFCSVAHLRGPQQKYRRKPTDLVLREVAQALDDGIGEIHFFDDLFAESEAQIIEFCEEIVRRNLRFHWFVAQGMPLWPLTRDALAAMKDAGMYRIIAPFESGNDRVLHKVVGKVHSSVAKHDQIAHWASEFGIELIGMFVVGLPGETRAEILDTLTFARDHPQIDYSVFSIATPMVGTKLMRDVIRQGQLDDSDKINRVIKRTVALYRTDAFREYELGIIRAFDWDRINFSNPEKCVKYAHMVGVTPAQLDQMRAHSKQTFYRFFPDYEGPLSFFDLYDQPDLFRTTNPQIPATLY